MAGEPVGFCWALPLIVKDVELNCQKPLAALTGTQDKSPWNKVLSILPNSYVPDVSFLRFAVKTGSSRVSIILSKNVFC